MANPANLTVTDLTANDDTAQPAGDTIDTDGTIPVLNADLLGASERLVIEVTNDDAVNGLDVTIEAGDNPPAARQGIGDLEVAIAESGVALVGPFEGARFLQDDGDIDVTFATDGGANASATVRAYLLPKTV